MTPAQLAEIRARCKGATWASRAAREDVLALLDEVARLRAILPDYGEITCGSCMTMQPHGPERCQRPEDCACEICGTEAQRLRVEVVQLRVEVARLREQVARVAMFADNLDYNELYPGEPIAVGIREALGDR